MRGKDEWWFCPETLHGSCLILGSGYDYKEMLTVDKQNNQLIIFHSRESNKNDKNFPYPILDEIFVPLDMLKELLDKDNK